MNIDWRKAPAWAVAHGLHETGFGIKEFWLGETQHQNLEHAKSFPYGGGDPSCGSFHNSRRASFSYVTPRPAPWTGEGLPPAGTVCEAMLPSAGHQWVEVLVVWHHPELEGSAAVVHGGGRLVGWSSAFRPIRTPEQIEAEERQAFIADAVFATDSETPVEWRKAVFGELYDLGYRKKVAP